MYNPMTIELAAQHRQDLLTDAASSRDRRVAREARARRRATRRALARRVLM